MKPLLLLHGALGATPQLEPLMKLMAQNGYDVHRLNFSGHGGESFMSNFGIEQFAEDVLKYMTKHSLSEVDVIGYSMGGYVALWLAYQHPARVGRIVTLGTKFDWSPASAEKEVKKLNTDKILEKVPAFARILEHRHAPNDWRELLQRTGDMMLQLGNAPLLTEVHFKAIATPVLVCLGDADDMADRSYSETVASVLPNGTFMLLENTPHPIEKVDLGMLSECINNFLR